MKELITIQSKLVATKDQKNLFGKYNYRQVEGILAAVKPLLLEEQCFITLTDDIVFIGNRFYIKATAAIHNANGEVIENHAFARESTSKKGMDEAQVTGSCSTYARKYALCGLLAIDDSSLDPDSRNNLKDAINNAKDIEELNELWQVRGGDISCDQKLVDLWQKRYAGLSDNPKEKQPSEKDYHKEAARIALTSCKTIEDLDKFLVDFPEYKEHKETINYISKKKAQLSA